MQHKKKFELNPAKQKRQIIISKQEGRIKMTMKLERADLIVED